MKEVLHQLATTYTIINPLVGMTPGSPMKDAAMDSFGNDLDEVLNPRAMSSWQAEAIAYVRDVKNKRNKFEVFCNDTTLDRIRTDKRLKHNMRSISLSSAGKKKKRDANKISPGQVSGNDDKDKPVAKTQDIGRKSSPRCVLCVAMLGGRKAKQSMYYCVTCGVHLCNKPHGNKQLSCFDRWHGVKNLSSLNKDASVTPNPKEPTRRSPRKSAAKDGSAMEGGKRRSLRKRKSVEVEQELV